MFNFLKVFFSCPFVLSQFLFDFLLCPQFIFDVMSRSGEYQVYGPQYLWFMDYTGTEMYNNLYNISTLYNNTGSYKAHIS